MQLSHAATEVLNYFANTRKGQAVIAEMTADEHARQLDERRTKGTRLKQLFGENSERHKKAEAEMKPLHAAVERATKALEEANQARYAIAARHRDEAWPIEREIDRLRNELEQGMQPELEAFIKRLRAEMLTLKYESIQGGWQQVTWSNHLSVRARQDAMSALIQNDLHAIAFEPIDGAELDKRLDKLYRSLPAVEERPGNL